MNTKETFLYKDILSKNLGSEFNANLEWELERVKDSGINIFYRCHLGGRLFGKLRPKGITFGSVLPMESFQWSINERN